MKELAVYSLVGDELGRDVMSLVWSFSRRTGIDAEELQAEAARHRERAKETFDPAKGASLATWTHLVVKTGLSYYCRQNRRTPPAKDEFDPDLLVSPHLEWRPDKRCQLLDDLHNLSKEAREVARIVLHSPEEVGITGMESAREMRGMIRNFLLDKFPQNRITDAFHEIESTFCKP
jgi:hypothetical protein